MPKPPRIACVLTGACAMAGSMANMARQLLAAAAPSVVAMAILVQVLLLALGACGAPNEERCLFEEQPTVGDAAPPDADQPWPRDAQVDDAMCKSACGGNPCQPGMINNRRVILCGGDGSVLV